MGRCDGQLGHIRGDRRPPRRALQSSVLVGQLLDESEPLEEHLSRPRLSRLSPATQASGPVEDEWLRDNLVAIAQLAESLDRVSFELAMRIVPFEWWAARLPDRPSAGRNLRT